MLHPRATQPRGVGARAARPPRAWLLGFLWVLPLLYAFWTAFHPPEFSTRFALSRAADARQLRQGLARGAVRALFPQHDAAGDDGARRAAGARHARRLRVRALRVPRPQRAVRAGAGAADDHARRADRRELPHDDRARPQGHDPRASACRTWRARSASSCCARRSRRVPRELDEAARVEGCTPLQMLWKVYVPLARPTYLAYALVSASATTGTISCGRSSSPTRSSRGR